MRYFVTGVDQDTGQTIELTVEAPDVAAAASIVARKRINATSVRAITPTPAQATHQAQTQRVQAPNPQAQRAQSQPTAQKRTMPNTSQNRMKPRGLRLWLSLVLTIAAVMTPVVPTIPLCAGIIILGLVVLYALPPARRPIGSFLRVSPDRPVWSTFKMVAFVLIGISLIGLSIVGFRAVQRGRELTAQFEAVRAAKAQADAASMAKVAALVDDARKSLELGDVPRAQELLDAAVRVEAPNHSPAESLRATIQNAGDKQWVLATLVAATDEEFASFRDDGKPPSALNLGHAVLTDQAIALARQHIDAATISREEAKRQAQATAERAQKAAEERAAAAKQAAMEAAAAERGEATITRIEYGDAWPFTVDNGVLRGKPTGKRTSGGSILAEVTFTANGTTYALNGIARESQRYAEVDAVWAKDPSIPGANKSIGPIIERGLELARRNVPPPTTTAAAAELDASVSFTGAEFVITNQNAYDWTGVKLEINPGIVSSGYVLRLDRIVAGQRMKVGSEQFTKSDGERFNPFTHKPQEFMIHCKQGDFFAGWN